MVILCPSFKFVNGVEKTRNRFNQRVRLMNGQCGGSRDGWCEVFQGKKRCIDVRAYRRLKAYREEESMKDGYIPLASWTWPGPLPGPITFGAATIKEYPKKLIAPLRLTGPPSYAPGQA